MSPTESISDEAVLLAEFNHRLFNTLQVIAATVSRCRRGSAGDATPLLLGELEERLASLGALHRLLSIPAPVSGLEDHCRKLCVLLVRAFGREDITPWVVMEDLDLSAEQIFRLPLLVVELVTNVLKHSLADQDGGMVWVDLRQRRGQIELLVSDSRKAPGPSFQPSRIVKALAHGLRGEAFVKEADGYAAGALIPFASAVQVTQGSSAGFRSMSS